jgi:large subunit ribosomal protein L21
MYAVIRTGGKQYRVEPGERLEVERLDGDADAELELTPVLVVDGERVLATRRELEGAVVRARVVGSSRGPKIAGFVYKPKSNQRRRFGHRQQRSVLEVTAIEPGGTARSSRARTPAGEED